MATRTFLSCVCMIILLVIIVEGSPCPCNNTELCKPITLKDRKEMFVFQVNDDWVHYDWTLVTTMVVAGKFRPEMVCTAHAANARVALIADFDVKQLRNTTATQAWIDHLVQQVKDTYTDGVNVDIESPIDRSDAPYLSSLLQNLTKAFHSAMPYSQVTFDVAWSPNCIDLRCYDYAGLAKASDFLFVMDYDMRSQIYGACVASANSPPTQIQQGMTDFIKLGIPANKLVLGLPWYGYDYPCENLVNNTVCEIKKVPFRGVNCSDAAGEQKEFDLIMRILANSSKPVANWDEELQSPWFNYEDPTTKKIHQVWFDNPRSLTVKTSWGKKLGLRGVGMWTGDFVDYSNPKNKKDTDAMWAAMRNFF